MRAVAPLSKFFLSALMTTRSKRIPVVSNAKLYHFLCNPSGTNDHNEMRDHIKISARVPSTVWLR
jgi:hypothetical protein